MSQLLSEGHSMSYPRVYASMIIKKVEEKDNDAKTASQHGSRESDIFLVLRVFMASFFLKPSWPILPFVILLLKFFGRRSIA